MLISKTVQVRWNGMTRKHYEDLGYVWTKQNDWFEIPLEHLMKTSVVRVEVKCDYCEDGVSMKPYRDYIKGREIVQRDCCKKRSCMIKKSEESNMIVYGVKNINQTEERKQQAREALQTPKEEVVRIAKSKGVEILNIQDYQNDRTRLNIICDRHKEEGIQETNFANIKKNKNCCIHINKEIVKGIKKIEGAQVVDEFISQNLIPMFRPEEYINNNTPLPYMCAKHMESGVQYRNRSNLFDSDGCGECVNERRAEAHRSPPEKVLKYFTDRNIKPLDMKQYDNRDSIMEFICLTHQDYIQLTNIGSLRNTRVPCAYCREENSLSTLNRRLRSSIGKWKDSIEKKCGYSCVLTGSKDYEVHHLYTFNQIILDSMRALGIPKKSKYKAEEIKEIKKEVVSRHKDVLGACLHPDLSY